MRSRGLLLLTAAVVSASAVPALAASRPRVSLSVSSSAEAGAPISAQWTATHVPRGSRVLVERPVGTARVWKPLLSPLGGSHGSLTIPAYRSFGVYPLRIAVIRDRKVLAQRERQVRIFAQIPFSTLLEAPLTGLDATQTATFAYVLPQALPFDGPQGEASETDIISDEHSRCDAIHVEFAGEALVPDRGEPDGGRVTVTIVQETAEPVSSTAPTDRVGSVEAHVALGQSWAVNLSVSEPPNAQLPSLSVYFNGEAHCYSDARFKNRPNS